MAKTERQIANALRQRQAGRIDEAIAQLQTLVQKIPGHLDGNFLLGSFLAENGQLAEALVYLTRARRLNPKSVQILNNLGNLHRLLGDSEAALSSYRQTTELDARFVQGWVNRGLVCAKLKRWDECLDSLTRIGGADCADADILRTLADARAGLGQTREAVQLYRRALAIDPEDRHGVAITLAILADEPLPARHTDAMVRKTYQTKAAGWDADVNRPQDSYYGPQLLHRLLADELAGKRAFDILDLGCGTGLCGEYLRPAAHRLVGVDLSPEMLRQAAGRGLYTDLIEAEIGTWLADGSEAFDLVTGAGVFIMFSHLEDIFSRVARRLHPGAIFALTLYESTQAPVEVRHNGHFGHSRAYLDSALGAAGLSALRVDAVIHETDDGQPQAGFAVLARNGGDANSPRLTRGQ